MEVLALRKDIQDCGVNGRAQALQETQEEREGLHGETSRDGCQLDLQVNFSRSFIGLLERHQQIDQQGRAFEGGRRLNELEGVDSRQDHARVAPHLPLLQQRELRREEEPGPHAHEAQLHHPRHRVLDQPEGTIGVHSGEDLARQAVLALLQVVPER